MIVSNSKSAQAAIVSLALLSCGGCVSATQVGHESSAGFKWVAVGLNEHGCQMFTKQSTSPDVIVDSAIWYLDANGHYVLDASACVPSSSNGVMK